MHPELYFIPTGFQPTRPAVLCELMRVYCAGFSCVKRRCGSRAESISAIVPGEWRGTKGGTATRKEVGKRINGGDAQVVR
jgi:hypothetical protein